MAITQDKAIPMTENGKESAVSREFNKVDNALERLDKSIEYLSKSLVDVKREPVPENPDPPPMEDINGTSPTTRRLGEIFGRIELARTRVDYIVNELEI